MSKKPSKTTKTGNHEPAKGLKGSDQLNELENLTFLNKLSPHLKFEMDELLKQKRVIQKRLKTKKECDLFASNPLLFFEKAKIELTPILKKRLRTFNPNKEFKSKKFILPNGDTMTPNIKINIIN